MATVSVQYVSPSLFSNFTSTAELVPPLIYTAAANCTDQLCHLSCVGYESCSTCVDYCAKEGKSLSDYIGPGGPGLTVFMCLMPLLVLVVVTLIPNPWKSTVSLPFAATLMFLVRLAYLGAEPINVTASIISGALDTCTPISIVAGAIILFETMGHTKCMPWMMRELKLLSKGHPIAEIMLIGWAFAYMVEGASGFGTPVALAAPMLAELGHPKMETMTLCLLTNTLATVFGAVGTPIWFGFGSLNLTDDELLQAGFKACLTVGLVAFIVVPLTLLILVKWQLIFKNIIFILLSIAVTVGPAIGISMFSYEFGSIVGGMVGIAGTGLLIRFRVGLRPYDPEAEAQVSGEPGASDVAIVPMENKEKESSDEIEHSIADNQGIQEEVDTGPRETGGRYIGALLLRTFPLTATVLLLVLTRIQPIGLKSMLRTRSPALVLPLQSLGVLEISAALVFYFHDIMTDKDVEWVYEMLYTPALVPFVLVSLVTMVIHYKDLDINPLRLFKETFQRLANPAISLMGAMVLVSLIRNGGYGSPAYLIGSIVSGVVGSWWILLSTYIGALGSFFSGSTTVSNLTFGQVQLVAAESIGVSATSMLALQAAGATMGNAICMANIINARAVMNLNHIGEGEFIKRTGPIVFLFGLLAEGIVYLVFILWE